MARPHCTFAHPDEDVWVFAQPVFLKSRDTSRKTPEAPAAMVQKKIHRLPSPSRPSYSERDNYSHSSDRHRGRDRSRDRGRKREHRRDYSRSGSRGRSYSRSSSLDSKRSRSRSRSRRSPRYRHRHRHRRHRSHSRESTRAQKRPDQSRSPTPRRRSTRGRPHSRERRRIACEQSPYPARKRVKRSRSLAGMGKSADSVASSSANASNTGRGTFVAGGMGMHKVPIHTCMYLTMSWQISRPHRRSSVIGFRVFHRLSRQH